MPLTILSDSGIVIFVWFRRFAFWSRKRKWGRVKCCYIDKYNSTKLFLSCGRNLLHVGNHLFSCVMEAKIWSGWNRPSVRFLLPITQSFLWWSDVDNVFSREVLLWLGNDVDSYPICMCWRKVDENFFGYYVVRFLKLCSILITDLLLNGDLFVLKTRQRMDYGSRYVVVVQRNWINDEWHAFSLLLFPWSGNMSHSVNIYWPIC